MADSSDSTDRAMRPTARSAVIYVVISLVAGVVTSRTINSTVTRSWHDCGVAGAGEGLTLLLLLVPNIALVALWWGVILRIGRRLQGKAPHMLRSSLMLLVCLLGSFGFLWFMMFLLHDPGQSAHIPVCPPGNIPPWWPSWLPI